MTTQTFKFPTFSGPLRKVAAAALLGRASYNDLIPAGTLPMPKPPAPSSSPGAVASPSPPRWPSTGPA